jgi:hypothetical protein
VEELLLNPDIFSAISLSVAPVFLIAGIAGALNVLSIRMGRIIDRGRKLNETLAFASEAETREIDEEQRLLAGRARLIHRAIALCTMSALFVCFVIISLFLDVMFGFDLNLFVAIIFVVALLCLIAGLFTFLREIEKSTSAFRFGKYSITKRLR